MLIRNCSVIAMNSILWLSMLCIQILDSPSLSAQDQKNQKKVKLPWPVEAKLIVMQKQYVLPKDRDGEAFRKKIVTETDCDNLPPAPKVDLYLELKNISDQDVMIWPRGSITYPQITLKGKGVVEPENLRSFSGQGSGTSVQPTIEPGKIHRIKIDSLNPEGGTPSYYWYLPGEYSIQASYFVYTGLPPFPFPDQSKPKGQKPKRYKVTTPPVKVKVVREKPKSP